MMDSETGYKPTGIYMGLEPEVFPQVLDSTAMPDLATGTAVNPPIPNFNVPYPNLETGIVNNQEWEAFVAEFYAKVMTATDKNDGFNLNREQVSDLLFFVYTNTITIPRYPVGSTDESQHTEFHHSLRVAAIANKEFELGNKGTFSALLHNALNTADEAEFKFRLTQVGAIVGDDMAGEFARQSRWMDFIEAIGESTHMIRLLVENGKNIRSTQELLSPDLAPEAVARALKGLTDANKILSKMLHINNFGTDNEAITSTIKEIQTIISSTSLDLAPGELHKALASVFIKTQLLMSTGSGELPMLVLTANLVDDLRFPRRADLDQESIHRPISNNFAIAYEATKRFLGEEDIPISKKMEEDYLEAKWFYIPSLDIHDQRALRVVKEIVTAWEYPHEFRNAYHAVEELRQEENNDFFDSRSRYKSLVTEKVRQYLSGEIASNGMPYRVLAWEDFEYRFRSLTRQFADQETCMAHIEAYLAPNEILIIRQRRKSLGSILEKLKDDEEYYQHHIARYWPDIQPGSVEYFKVALNLIQDINAATIVTADTLNEADRSPAAKRQFAKYLLTKIATYLTLTDPQSALNINPFLGVRPDKYDVTKGNDPNQALRVYDRTKKSDEDNYFSITFCYEGEMGYNPKTEKQRWPMRGEILCQDFASWFNALCHKAGHPRYKLADKGIVPKDMIDELNGPMLAAVIT